MLPVVLGTSSRWRKSVIDDHTAIKYTLMTADIDERAITAGFPCVYLLIDAVNELTFVCRDRSAADPAVLTLAIAKAKADAILPKITVRIFTVFLLFL